MSERITNEELETRFTYHAPKEGQAEKYVFIRKTALRLAHILVENAPNCRERSLAMTKLEESIFWVNAAIARRE